MPHHEQSLEVLVAQGDVVQVTACDVLALGSRASASPRRRARLCAHRDAAQTLHEMFICLHRDTYIRPHKHAGKVESFHVIQGEVDVLLFDDEGHVTQVIALGEFGSGKPFYYRLSIPAFHSVVPRTQHVFFHETTNGPFRADDTLYPDWAPTADQTRAAAEYLTGLKRFLEERAAA